MQWKSISKNWWHCSNKSFSLKPLNLSFLVSIFILNKETHQNKDIKVSEVFFSYFTAYHILTDYSTECAFLCVFFFLAIHLFSKRDCTNSHCITSFFRTDTYCLSNCQGEVAQSCPTLCNPVDCSLPGSSVHGILQARILEYVAISFSRESSWPRDQTCVSYVSCIGRWVLYH